MALSGASWDHSEAPLVNENPEAPKQEENLAAKFLYGGVVQQEEQKNQAKLEGGFSDYRKTLLPKTWFGEVGAGLKQGVDQFQQLMYSGGAFAADAVGADGLRDSFIKGSEQQDREIRDEPMSVDTTDKIDGFDSFMRWFSGSAGKVAPQLAESIIAGIGGGILGAEAGPAGVAGGAITGFVERQAVRQMLKTGLKGMVEEGAERATKKELINYARGTLAKEGLSDGAKAVLVNETKDIFKQYGANAAIGLNSWRNETASIYDDMSKDPNMADSDKKTAALFGGLVAAIPDTALQAYIVNKFFPGKAKVSSSEIKDATGYFMRFAKEAVKELPLVAVGEAGEEYAQTLIETAAKTWANPETRSQIFNYTPEQFSEAFESAAQGAVGGLMGGVVAAHGAALKPHSNPMVRKAERGLRKAADDVTPLAVDPTDEDRQFSEIQKRKEEINTALGQPDLQETAKGVLLKELEGLKAKEEAINQSKNVIKATHRSNSEITEFDDSKISTDTNKNYFGIGHYFTPEGSKDIEGLGGTEHYGKNVMSVDLDIKNPFKIDMRAKRNTEAFSEQDEKARALGSEELNSLLDQGKRIDTETIREFGQQKWTQLLKDKGYDGVIYTSDNGNQEALAFSSKQAKVTHINGKPVAVSQEPKLRPIDTTLDHLRAMWGKRIGDRTHGTMTEDIDPEKVTQKRAELDSLVNKSLEGFNGSEEESAKFRQTIHESFDDRALNFLAQKGVKIRALNAPEFTQRFKGKTSFAAFDDAQGNIVLTIPTYEQFKRNAAGLDTAHLTKDQLEDPKFQRTEEQKAQAQGDYLKGTPVYVAHELIHVADLLTVKDQWKADTEAGTSKENLSDYEERVMVERGKLMKKAIGESPQMQKMVSEAVHGVYNFGTIGASSDRVVGQEMTRMAVELARTGKLTEFTQALARAARESKESDAPSQFLKSWITAIKGIYNYIAKLIDPNNKSMAEFLKVFNAINDVLDQYGVLVNEKQKTQRNTKPKEEAKVEAKPEEKVENEFKESDVTVGHVLDNANFKVEYEGQVGRLSLNEGALVLTKSNEKNREYLIQDVVNRATKLSDLGIKVRHENTLVNKIQDTADQVNSLTEEEAESVMPPTPIDQEKWYIDAIESEALQPLVKFLNLGEQRIPKGKHPIETTPEYQEALAKITDEQLNKASDIATTTIQRVQNEGLPKEEEARLVEPLEAAWMAIEALKEKVFYAKVAKEEADKKAQAKLQKENAAQQPPVAAVEPAPEPAKAEPAKAEPVVQPEAKQPEAVQPVREAAPVEQQPTGSGPAEGRVDKTKQRVTKAERTEQRLKDAIEKAKKSKHVTDAIRAYLAHKAAIKDKPTAKEFVGLYKQKGFTQKSYNEILQTIVKDKKEEAPRKKSEVEDLVNKNPSGSDVEPINKEPARMSQIEETAKELGIKYDGPIEAFNTHQFTDITEGPAYKATYTVRGNATPEEIREKTQRVRESFGGKTPARMSDLDPRDQAIIMAGEAEADATNWQAVKGMTVGRERTRKVPTTVSYENFTPEQLTYQSEPNSTAEDQALRTIDDNGGAVRTAMKLVEDPMGMNLNIEDNGDPTIGPSGTLRAIYEQVTQQIDAILTSRGYDLNSDAEAWLTKLGNQLQKQATYVGKGGGRFNQVKGLISRLWTKRGIIETINSTLQDGVESVIGKEGKQAFKDAQEELNQLWSKYGHAITTHPKVIAALRKISDLVDEKRFAKGMRETIVRNVDHLRRIIRKAAARMAEYQALDEDGEKYINQATKGFVKELSGAVRDVNAPGELQLFRNVIAKTIRDVGRSMKLIADPQELIKASVKDQIATVLKNEPLYQEFVKNLVKEYIAAYGGINPTQQFQDDAELLYARLQERSYRDDIVKDLVNESMKENEVAFSKIVKEKYKDGEATLEGIKKGIIEHMKVKGVENEALLNQLAQDIQSNMDKRVEIARGKYFGSSTTLNEFMKHAGTSIREAARDYAGNVNDLQRKFEDELVKRGFPNSPSYPIAATIAEQMTKAANELLVKQREKIKEGLVKKAGQIKNVKQKAKFIDASTKLMHLANVGILSDQKAYEAVQEVYGLPKYNEDLVNKIIEAAGKHSDAAHKRQRDNIKQQIAQMMAQHKEMSTGDMKLAWYYMSILSGPGTQIVNVAGNAFSLASYIGTEMTRQIVKNPRNIGRVLSAVVRTAMGAGQLEAREAFFTGMMIDKAGQKFYMKNSPLEVEDPTFKSSMRKEGLTGNSELDEKIADIDEKTAKMLHTVSRKLKGRYVGRLLSAMDIFFYKIAQETALQARYKGLPVITPEMWESALEEARKSMVAIDENPVGDAALTRRQHILAHELLNDPKSPHSRFINEDPALVNERIATVDEANRLALDVTFQQDPRGILGHLSKAIEYAAEKVPLLRAIVPFTRVAANITNLMLDWTPYGTIRYLAGHNLGDDFRIMKDGEKTRDADIAIRSLLGMAGIIAFQAVLATQDDDDPFIAVYGDGPKDINQRRLLMEQGWKPNSMKVGSLYMPYTYAPQAMALAIIGRWWDKYRSGETASPYDMSMASASVALLEAVKNQSFIASMSDLLSAIDSNDPERKLSIVFARIMSSPVPNAFKQLDRWIDPSLQEADGFAARWLKELPAARHLLRPAINNFGQPIERSRGIIPIIPGTDRLAVWERTGDPLIDFLGARRLVWPGYSRSTKLNGNPVGEHYYEYVQTAGQRIHQELSSTIEQLKGMNNEDAQKIIDEEGARIKKEVRDSMIIKYNIPKVDLPP